MAIDIHAQAVTATLAASQKTTVSKDNAVSKDVEKSTPKAEISKPVVNQVVDVQAKDVKISELSKEKMQEAVNKLQDYVDKYNRDLKFSIDNDTGRTVVRLLDGDSNVLKQYPSEDILSIISNLEQNKGLFIGEA